MTEQIVGDNTPLLTSKYIKPERETKVFRYVSIMFLFSLFVMPQYFGLPTPVFDFTILRMMIVIISVMIIADVERKDAFFYIIKHSKFTFVLIPYLFVITYTMVLRVDINAFLNPFIELYSLYLCLYIIKDVLGVKDTLKYLTIFMYILVFQGIIEFVIGRSLFSYLVTIDGIYTGRFVRSGHYRIMGPCNHSLGYGLMLVCMAPIIFFNGEKGRIDVFNRPALFILLFLNVFLTGSRSTLCVFVIEVVLIFLLSDNENKKKFILLMLLFLAGMSVFLILFNNTDIARYIMLQITTILDEVLGTEFSVKYGANLSALGSSSNYREQLKYIFKVDWLNPLLGIGRKRNFSAVINGSYVKSVDDFYIAEYIRYAYPGLISFVLFLTYFLKNMTAGAFGLFRNSGTTDNIFNKNLCRIILTGTVCYLINLKWVDSLQTLKYMYILFAIYCGIEQLWLKNNQEQTNGKAKSKYIKEEV